MKALWAVVLLAACGGPTSPGIDAGSEPTPARIQVTPAVLAFGSVTGASKTLSVKVKNLGGSVLKLGPLAFAPMSDALALTVQSYPAEGIATGGEAQIDVKVTPTSKGMKTSALVIASTASEVKVAISWDTGVEPPPCTYAVTPQKLEFGNVGVGAPRELTLTISQTGGPCTLDGVTIAQNAAFSLRDGPIAGRSLAAGETVAVVVRVLASVGPGLLSGSVNVSVGGVQTGVPISAKVVTTCLTVTPNDLSFGTTGMGCSLVGKTVTVINTCPDAVTVKSLSMVAPAGEPAGGPHCLGTAVCPEFVLTSSTIPPNMLIAPGAAVALRFEYRPINTGPDNGAFQLRVEHYGQVVDSLVTLMGTGDLRGPITDSFSNLPLPKSDTLFVIDNSPSMATKQAMTTANLDQAFTVLSRSDFHIGVTTTDPANSGKLIGDVNNPTVLTRQTPNARAKFVQKFTQLPPTPTGPQTLAMMAAAVSPAALASDNAGFLRSGIPLSVYAVSDSDDQSPLTVAAYVALLSAAQPNRFFNAVGPIAPPAPAGCSYATSTGAPRLLDAVTAANGNAGDVCDAAWSGLFGITIVILPSLTYFLDELADPLSVVVKVDGVVVNAKSSTGTVVWVFDDANNVVRFTNGLEPGPGTNVDITYFPACP